jgi:glc operon protein GlcG
LAQTLTDSNLIQHILTNWNPRAMAAMTTLAVASILATVFCLPAEAQTISVTILDQAGAQIVLQAAIRRAQKRNAPSAIAVVDPAGDLIAFQPMDGVRQASVELAIQKARTAARLQRPTAEIEDSINHGRTALVTAGIASRRGGMPLRLNGESRWSGGYCWLKQGSRCRRREARGGGVRSISAHAA